MINPFDFDPQAPTLDKWRKKNLVRETLLWRGAAETQTLWALDTLPRAVMPVGWCQEDDAPSPVLVVSDHMSKSVVLPVYGVALPELGLFAVLRDNFYNWMLSLAVATPVNLDLFHGKISSKRIAPCYCEGFRPDWVFGTYTDNTTRFTTELGDNFDAYALLFYVAQTLRQKVGT